MPILPLARRAVVVTAIVAVGVPIAAQAAKSPPGPTATTTAVTCSPNPLHYPTDGTSAQCAVTVTATGKTPTGTVSVTSDRDAPYPGPTCTLSGGTCSVAYAPHYSGRATVTASYAGSGQWQASSGATGFTVMQATTTSVSCSPDTVGVGTSTTCRATVNPQYLAGSYTWSTTSRDGRFGSETCGNPGDCTVTYTTGSTAETATISATFHGSAYEDPSTGSTTVTSRGRPVTITKADAGAVYAGDWICNNPDGSPYCAYVSAHPGACIARLTDAADGHALPGEPLAFGGACEGSATTDGNGVAWLPASQPVGLYTRCWLYAPCAAVDGYTVSFAGDGIYGAAVA